jgi:septal ring factor EnvC (AmiA/AmiB activator)
MPDFLTLVVTVVLSGGLAGGAASLITGRAMARKTTAEAKSLAAKLPAEVDSVVVQGAEQAVLTMSRALESATTRIGQLEQERADDAERIKKLERDLEALRRKVGTAERALQVATAATASLQAELSEFVRSTQTRRQ